MVLFSSGGKGGTCDCGNVGESGGCLCCVGTLATILLFVILGIMFIIDGISDFQQIADHNQYTNNLNNTLSQHEDECYILDIFEFSCQCDEIKNNMTYNSESNSNRQCKKYLYYAISYETCGNLTLISDNNNNNNCISSTETNNNDVNYNQNLIKLNETITCYITDCNEEIFSMDRNDVIIDNGEQEEEVEPVTKLIIGIVLLFAPYFALCCTWCCASYCSSQINNNSTIRYDKVEYDI